VTNRKKPPPRKKSAHERWLPIVGAIFVVLTLGVGGGLLYKSHAERMSTEVAYLKIPSVSVRRAGYSIRASFAVRTSAADAAWARTNKKAFEQAITQVLMEVDPVRVRAPGGIKMLQDGVREAGGAASQTTRVQEILVTDLLVW
jgi:hypothetical protein